MKADQPNDQLTVGEKLVWVDRVGAEPLVVTITKLTKTQIVVTHPTAGPQRFRRQADWNGGRKNIGSFAHKWAELFDLMRWDDLMRAWEERRLASEQRLKAEAERQQQIADRHAAELAEVKEAMGQYMTFKYHQQNPDGSRLYIFDVPVKAKHTERKKGWCTVMVLCRTSERRNWKTEEDELTIEVASTWINGGSTGFPNCSVWECADDTEALWETACRVYHDWS